MDLMSDIIRLTKPMRDTYYLTHDANKDGYFFTEYILYINHYLESVLTSKGWKYDSNSGMSYHPMKDCTLTGEMTGDYSMTIRVNFASGASFDVLTGLTFNEKKESVHINFGFANLIKADGTKIEKPTRTNLKPIE